VGKEKGTGAGKGVKVQGKHEIHYRKISIEGKSIIKGGEWKGLL